jgi:hypothetical protein
MIMSGVMLGYLHRSNANKFQRIQTKLIDRGLFLLTIGHVLIALAHSGVAGGILEAFNWGFITDAIGVSIINFPVLFTGIRIE